MIGLLKSLAASAHNVPTYADARFPPSMYYKFLWMLSMHMSPAICVELGVCGGGGSLYMAWASKDNLVIGVDVSNEYPEQIEYIQREFQNFRFWRMDSVRASLCAALEEDTYPVDILFIDTIHTEKQTMLEFEAWRPLLSDRAVVVLDDLYRDGMDRAWNRIPGSKLRLDEMHIGGSPTDGGFGVIWNPNGWK